MLSILTYEIFFTNCQIVKTILFCGRTIFFIVFTVVKHALNYLMFIKRFNYYYCILNLFILTKEFFKKLFFLVILKSMPKYFFIILKNTYVVCKI